MFPCINQRPDIDNLLVKVTCYAKYGLSIAGFTNVIIQLPLIISYIHNIKKSKTIQLFSTLSIECVWEFLSYKRKDNRQLFDDMIQKGLLKFCFNYLISNPKIINWI